jgi:hypothetical protein
LIRYLIEIRINRSLVWMSTVPEKELAWRWGTAMAEQMAITRARSWKKALSSGRQEEDASPGWPVEAVLRLHTPKRTLGLDEHLFLELKLLGDGADHAFFMETMLPALEILGSEPAAGGGNSRHPNSLYGHFDILSVRSAKGRGWKPLIRDGRLDLRFKVHGAQWEKGYRMSEYRPAPVHRLVWRTPFDFSAPSPPDARTEAKRRPPELPEFLERTADRLGRIYYGPYAGSREFVGRMKAECAAQWHAAMEMAAKPRVKEYRLKKVPGANHPALIGYQTFNPAIPPELFPFLTLGHLVHLGRGALFGQGLFGLA